MAIRKIIDLQISTIWVTYFAPPSPDPPISAQSSSGYYTQATTFQFLAYVFQLPTTFLMPFAIARRPKEAYGELIGAERAQWNPKSSPERPKKESLGAKLILYGTRVVRTEGMRVPIVTTIGINVVSKPR